MGREGQSMGERCRHEQPVGWVAVETLRQLIQCQHHVDIQWQHRHHTGAHA